MLRPEVPARLVGVHPSTLGGRILRVLGVRRVVQAIATLAAPSRRSLAVGAAVDVMHAATAFAFGALDRRHRAALLDGCLAAAWAGAGARAAATWRSEAED